MKQDSVTIVGHPGFSQLWSGPIQDSAICCQIEAFTKNTAFYSPIRPGRKLVRSVKLSELFLALQAGYVQLFPGGKMQTINILPDCIRKENCHDMDRSYLNAQRTKWVARICSRRLASVISIQLKMSTQLNDTNELLMPYTFKPYTFKPYILCFLNNLSLSNCFST